MLLRLQKFISKKRNKRKIKNLNENNKNKSTQKAVLSIKRCYMFISGGSFVKPLRSKRYLIALKALLLICMSSALTSPTAS